MSKVMTYKSTQRLLLFFTVIGMLCIFKNSFADEPEMSATFLAASYSKLDKQLSNNQFKRPLYITSAESSHDLKGEIYAVVDYPFNTVNQALNNPEHWCDVLILHINIKYCHAAKSNQNTLLTVDLGKKFDQPLADTYRVDFNYHEVVTKTDYFAVELNAKDGPLGTHDYRIWIEATPIKNGRTFLHFTYTYSFGLSGRLAMKAYLATAGRDKVGFTILNQTISSKSTDTKVDTKTEYIQGVRGVIERNTMRYYLAIEAYLNALNTPLEAQLDKRLQNWYNSTDQYAVQLHEVERDDYLAMKHKEYQRQQVAQ